MTSTEPALQLVDTQSRRFSAEPITEAEACAMFRACLNLFRHWHITDEQAAVLLDLPVRTYRRWKAGGPDGPHNGTGAAAIGRISRDGRARLSNLLGIHKSLRIIFREPRRGYEWIKQPNRAFAGASALDVMLGGELTDLMRVRGYLDAERGCW